jgi:hypothetical protein
MKLYQEYFSFVLQEGPAGSYLKTRIWRLINKFKKADKTLKKKFDDASNAYKGFHIKNK